MFVRCISGVVIAALASIAGGQTVFGPGSGDTYGTGTGSGHGGAVTPYVLTSHIFADVPEHWRVVDIEEITVRGMFTTDARSLQIAIRNGTEVGVLQVGMPNGANLNGDYTFVDDPTASTLNEVAATLSDAQTVPSGRYRMSGGILIFGNAGNGTDLDHFAGTSVRPGWSLLFLNYSLQNTGRFDSWTATVRVSTVPEPSGIGTLAFGALLALRRRKLDTLKIHR